MKQTAENKVKAGTAGGIEAAVKAINTHIDNAGVCEQGCIALKSITLNGKALIKQQKQNTMKMGS